MNCPFCENDPYEYVDVGLGGRGVPVAVTCCELGMMLFDDRSEDQRWSKLMGLVSDELPDDLHGEARMLRAEEILQRLKPQSEGPRGG